MFILLISLSKICFAILKCNTLRLVIKILIIVISKKTMKNKAEYIQFVLVMQLVITNGQKVLVIGTDSGISFNISNE